MRTAAIVAVPDDREQVRTDCPLILPEGNQIYNEAVAPELRIALRASNDTVAELWVYLAE